MEDNNVNNIIQNNEDELSAQSLSSSAEENLNFSQNIDEFTGSEGGCSSISISSSGSTSSVSSSSSGITQASTDNLTPILLILEDGTELDDNEEPVLLEEDDSTQYTIEQNKSQTDIYTITVGSSEITYYTDEDHVIAVLDSNNNIVDNENNEGDTKITAKIDQTWCTVSFVHPLNSPFQMGKYNLSSSNFSHNNDIKVVVPVIHCDANTSEQRTANITFQIQNLDTDLKMKVIQANNIGTYKYTIYMVLAINISRKIDVFGNTPGTVIQASDIDSLTIVNGQYSNIIEPTQTYNKNFGQYNKTYNYVVSRLMYAHDIELSDQLTNTNDKLKLFVNNLNKSNCLTDCGGTEYEFKSQTYLPSSYQKNINDILGITDDYMNSDTLVLYQGENWQENTYWETLNDDLTTMSRYNPFDDLGSFIGNNDNTSSTVKKICNITTDDLHLIIYNQTLNTVVKDINWTDWTKKGEYNIIARALWTGVDSIVNENVSSGGNLCMTIGTTQTPNDINVLDGNAGNYKISELLFLIENNRLSINVDGEQFSYLANSNGLVHNSGYDFSNEYGDYYVIDVSDKITQNGTVVNLKDIDNFSNITICIWFKLGANHLTLIGTIDLGGVWPNEEEAYIGFYD